MCVVYDVYCVVYTVVANPARFVGVVFIEMPTHRDVILSDADSGPIRVENKKSKHFQSKLRIHPTL